MLEGALLQALEDAGLSGYGALSAARMRLWEEEPSRPPTRRLGMEMCAKWRKEWDWERGLEIAREDLHGSGVVLEMSEEQLIQAAEEAKKTYRRELRGDP